MGNKSGFLGNVLRPVIKSVFKPGLRSVDRQIFANNKLQAQLENKLIQAGLRREANKTQALVDKYVGSQIAGLAKGSPEQTAKRVAQYKEFRKTLPKLREAYSEKIEPNASNQEINRALANIGRSSAFADGENAIIGRNITQKELAKLDKYASRVADRKLAQEQQMAQNYYDEVLGRYNRMVARKQPLNRAKMWINENPKMVAGALIGGSIPLGASMLYKIATEPQEQQSKQQSKQQQNKWTPVQGSEFYQNGDKYIYSTNNHTYDDYLQDSDGTIYSRSGEVLGNIADPIALSSSGYNNIFDYNAAQAGIDPSQVAKLQQELGINADGKFGAQTQLALQEASKNWARQFDPNSLVAIYQRNHLFS